ncbi:MAG: NifB/NifX family molybdenum-iron cluster-binding protein [Spirochaetota bacterium]|nr:NifB/NifX family molybdenum-iron cluster-binding protein [Spirochaetota bacterium]
MKIEKTAFPVYKDRISPLFDVSDIFFIVDIINESIGRKHIYDISNVTGIKKIDRLEELGVSIVICSAISKIFADSLLSRGIDLIPGIIGKVNDVVHAYLNNCVMADAYIMPGCKWRRRYKGGQGFDNNGFFCSSMKWNKLL